MGLMAERCSAFERRLARSVDAAWRNQTKSTTSAATTTMTLHQGRTEKAANGETTTTSNNDARKDSPRTRRADIPAVAWMTRDEGTEAAWRVRTSGVRA